MQRKLFVAVPDMRNCTGTSVMLFAGGSICFSSSKVNMVPLVQPQSIFVMVPYLSLALTVTSA